MAKKYLREDLLDKNELKKLNSKAKDDLCYEIAVKLRTYLCDNHLTSKEFAQLCDIKESCISSYINAEAHISLKNIMKMTEKMNVSVDYLLGKSKIKSSDAVNISINKELGLSELAIENLRTIRKNDKLKKLLKTINFLLENELYFENEEYLQNELVEIENDIFIDEEQYSIKDKENKIKQIKNKLQEYHNKEKSLKPKFIISKINEYFNTYIEKPQTILFNKNKIYKENELGEGLNKIYFTNPCKKISIENKLVDNVLLDELKSHLILSKECYKFNKEGDE